MEILTASQMYAADKETHAKIMPETQLMENAGFAAACEISKRYQKRPVLVLCGSGNNGGDGFVTARVLAGRGWPVDVIFAGDPAAMGQAARTAAEKFSGPVVPACLERLEKLEKQGGLVVDALFGIGLSRPITGDIADLIDALNLTDIPCVAIDIPSGVEADTGAVLGTAPVCEMTVTFTRPKIGHYLYPAKDYVGELVVCPIGIPDKIIEKQKPDFFENTAELFTIPRPTPYDHKYTRGAVLVCAGQMTGAARLAAQAARRAGAGLVKMACRSENFIPCSCDMPGTVIAAADTAEDFHALVNDPKIAAIVIGMGFGVTPETKDRLEAIAATGKPFVADADALRFIEGLDLSKAVITPHEGEFARLFPKLSAEDKLTKALKAAEKLGCIVVLKGADTVIASPEGLAAINTETNFALATAGSGDVLSGIIGAMLSKGLDPFEAACAGVRVHSAAAILAGDRLIAEDIIAKLG